MPKLVKSYPLHQSPFYKLGRRDKLARLLGIDCAKLKFLARAADSLYREFEVAKKKGGRRAVEEPADGLKEVQRKIAVLLGRIAPPDYLFCPVKGRCYVTNAAQHRGQRVVRCLDIRKYFPNTPFERVLWFFRSVMRCSEDVAWHLAKLATFKGHLPTGSPLSPIMAYFAHYDVWEAIAAICEEHGYVVTVYIDDVTISGSNVSAAVLWRIKKEIHRAGLRYHKEKAYIGRPAEVTGIIVAGEALLVPNRQLQKLNLARKAFRKTSNPLERTAARQVILGLSSQVSQVRKAVARPR